MSKHRLINCEFINAASFKNSLSNRAKLLYLLMFVSADDRGFVDTTQDLINALEKNDSEVDKNVSLELIQNTYNTAIDELVDKGLVYEFKDNHNNKVHLVRHWFYHNKLIKGLWTNYKNFLELVYLDNNEYILGKKPLKEDKIKEYKTMEIKVNEIEENPEETKKMKLLKELGLEDMPYDISLEELEKMKEEQEKQNGQS